MSSYADLDQIGYAAQTRSKTQIAGLLLPVAYLLAAVGYYGPWIGHATAGLSLSGADMGEFVKFLPQVRDGSLSIVRQFFYLPPVAIVVSIALVAGSTRLKYSWPARALMLAFAVPVSLQILPPAWSPASLTTDEFRLQAISLGLCWLLLGSFWLLGRLPAWMSSSLRIVLALLSGVLCTWQFALTKPAINTVYRQPPNAGWGFFLCLFGLIVAILADSSMLLQMLVRGKKSWHRF